MNRILSFAACIAAVLIMPVRADAQKQRKWDAQPYKYEVRAGWGMPNTEVYYCNVYDSPIFAGTGTIIDDLYRKKRGAVYSTGGIFAEFNMNFRRWFTLSMTGSCNAYWADVYDPVTDKVSDPVGGCQVGLIPVARFSFLSRPVFRMYGSVGIGVVADISGSGVTVFPAWQFTPIGVAVGKDLFGFCEVVTGVYNHASGLYFGVGYRF